mgnify:CR=1 FL=1
MNTPTQPTLEKQEMVDFIEKQRNYKKLDAIMRIQFGVKSYQSIADPEYKIALLESLISPCNDLMGVDKTDDTWEVADQHPEKEDGLITYLDWYTRRKEITMMRNEQERFAKWKEQQLPKEEKSKPKPKGKGKEEEDDKLESSDDGDYVEEVKK